MYGCVFLSRPTMGSSLFSYFVLRSFPIAGSADKDQELKRLSALCSHKILIDPFKYLYELYFDSVPPAVRYIHHEWRTHRARHSKPSLLSLRCDLFFTGYCDQYDADKLARPKQVNSKRFCICTQHVIVSAGDSTETSKLLLTPFITPQLYGKAH